MGQHGVALVDETHELELCATSAGRNRLPAIETALGTSTIGSEVDGDLVVREVTPVAGAEINSSAAGEDDDLTWSVTGGLQFELGASYDSIDIGISDGQGEPAVLRLAPDGDEGVPSASLDIRTGLGGDSLAGIEAGAELGGGGGVGPLAGVDVGANVACEDAPLLGLGAQVDIGSGDHLLGALP